MIRPPLIGIRFAGLDQHSAGWSQSLAHICREWVAENLSVSSYLAHHQSPPPIPAPPKQNHGPWHHARCSEGQTSSEQTHAWQLSCARQALIRGSPYWHLSWFVSTLTVRKRDSWDVCSVTARTDTAWGEKTEVKGGGAGMRIRSLPAIFSVSTSPPDSGTHICRLTGKNINIKCRHTLALVPADALCQLVLCFLCFSVNKWGILRSASPLNLFWRKNPVCFDFNLSDMSWQTMEGSGWWDIALPRRDDGSYKAKRIGKKGTRRRTHALIMWPPSPGDICDPANKHLFGQRTLRVH